MSTHATDHKNEGDLIAAQESAANRDKARRAREQFEKAYEARIKDERRASGCCVLCGETLSTFARLRRASRHFRCSTFIE